MDNKLSGVGGFGCDACERRKSYCPKCDTHEDDTFGVCTKNIKPYGKEVTMCIQVDYIEKPTRTQRFCKWLGDLFLQLSRR